MYTQIMLARHTVDLCLTPTSPSLSSLMVTEILRRASILCTAVCQDRTSAIFHYRDGNESGQNSFTRQMSVMFRRLDK